ncbi:HAMP domain-containing protein [Paenibacillus sp. HJL G12]|uniref:HAMP domain-containing protein n=1 Tax=Paenibacillus dendrobii TaxID=2691084 RepID=A0A7X3INJ6_9BACL|nr:sensor histidine kinase [Paenibacillus dendrobii]MWV47199.1 HAMP domain-containing protein [Paenibacillus dendrobii]
MQTGKFKWFRNQRIQNKIIFVYLPLMVIPLVLLGLFSYTANTNSIVSKTKKNMLDESRLITTRIDTIMSNAESFANIAMLDLNKEVKLKTLELKAKNDGELPMSEDHMLRNQIENKLDFAQLIFREVESAVFIDRNQNMYTTDARLMNGSTTGFTSDMFQKVEHSNGIMIWFPMQKRNFWVLDEGKPVLTVGKKILDMETMETLGYLFVNINEKTLSNVYNPVGPDLSTGYYIVDSRGTIISSGDEKQVLKPLESARKKEIMSQDTVLEETRKDNGEKILLTAMPFGHSDWKLVDEISLTDLTRETRKVSRIIVIVGGLCFLLALLGSIILSGVIAAPIMALAKHMNRIRDENIDRPVEVKSRDEVGMLGAGLNMMLGRINDLIMKVRDEQKLKREYELALIQEQIKPHFFYNTLDLIYVLCKTGESEEAGKATKALADFYRVALSNGKEIITVREEIQNLHSYLYIQTARYSDLFDFRIDVPAELMGYSIPKLTLQPLVENAIYHGLKEKGSFGHIIIEGRQKEEAMELKVIDNGIGFSPEQLEWFKKGKEGSESFGLKSVDERIRLYFGDRYGIRIHSTLGTGAEVTVMIPLSKGETYNV